MAEKRGEAAVGAEGGNGYSVVARVLARAGIRAIFGVIGIPVTELASAAQAVGIRFFSFRNEQAAGYAAAAYGYLTGVPGVLLTVSGPGAVHGMAGLAHAFANTWPLVMLSGSAEQGEVGQGSFQELDQVAAVAPFCKAALRVTSVADIAPALEKAIATAARGRPGAAYVDLPSDLLFAAVEPGELPAMPAGGHPAPWPGVPRPRADAGAIARAAALLRSAKRPLLVVGKGAAHAHAEGALRALASATGLPVLTTAMGRGVVPDSAPTAVHAARSAALAGADVALVVGARLNWQLHFGAPPKWAAGVRFVLADIHPSARDARLAAVTLCGDAGVVAQQLRTALDGLDRGAFAEWTRHLQDQAEKARAKLESRMAATTAPLDYATALRCVRDALRAVAPAPIVIAEGANTMDNARLPDELQMLRRRLMLGPVEEPRTRLDAATWGTMGVGLGYAIAAAAAAPGRLVVAVEGDSAFGFSGMECETIARYKLPIVVLVLNNNGIYGGDRRAEALRAAAAAGAAAGGFSADPIPTAFVPDSRYEKVMEAFGGHASVASNAAELSAACRSAFAAMRPALINVTIDPMAGVESGNVHSFNAPKSKM